jgi:hypothetical protein
MNNVSPPSKQRCGVGDVGCTSADIPGGFVLAKRDVIGAPMQKVAWWHTIRCLNPDALAAELNHAAFIPLRLRLSDGREVEILNPGLCFIARMALYFFRARPHDALAEHVQVISLQHIASIETIAPTN